MRRTTAPPLRAGPAGKGNCFPIARRPRAPSARAARELVRVELPAQVSVSRLSTLAHDLLLARVQRPQLRALRFRPRHQLLEQPTGARIVRREWAGEERRQPYRRVLFLTAGCPDRSWPQQSNAPFRASRTKPEQKTLRTSPARMRSYTAGRKPSPEGNTSFTNPGETKWERPASLEQGSEPKTDPEKFKELYKDKGKLEELRDKKTALAKSQTSKGGGVLKRSRKKRRITQRRGKYPLIKGGLFYLNKKSKGKKITPKLVKKYSKTFRNTR